MYDDDDLFKPIVIVTGFGPFINHPINASWEAVKLMNKDEIEQKYNIELVLLELSVTYENIDEFVPALWETHTPKLMIHTGVSNIAECFTLEMQAHRKGYQKLDYADYCPVNFVCPVEGAVRLHTKLNVEQLCEKFNDLYGASTSTRAVSSKDAGRYINEYIYYTSLGIDNTRTIFVNVPDTHLYSSEKTAKGLEHILGLCLQQLKEAELSKHLTDKLKVAASGQENKL